jgi:hypothetical protein
MKSILVTSVVGAAVATETSFPSFRTTPAKRSITTRPSRISATNHVVTNNKSLQKLQKLHQVVDSDIKARAVTRPAKVAKPASSQGVDHSLDKISLDETSNPEVNGDASRAPLKSLRSLLAKVRSSEASESAPLAELANDIANDPNSISPSQDGAEAAAKRELSEALARRVRATKSSTAARAKAATAKEALALIQAQVTEAGLKRRDSIVKAENHVLRTLSFHFNTFFQTNTSKNIRTKVSH